jgi:hypothetical protein
VAMQMTHAGIQRPHIPALSPWLPLACLLGSCLSLCAL